MSLQDASDAILRSLERLPMLAPDSVRAERVQARCRAELARIQRRPGRAQARGPFAESVLAALVAGVCVVYFVAVVGNALRLHGVF